MMNSVKRGTQRISMTITEYTVSGRVENVGKRLFSCNGLVMIDDEVHYRNFLFRFHFHKFFFFIPILILFIYLSFYLAHPYDPFSLPYNPQCVFLLFRRSTHIRFLYSVLVHKPRIH